MEGCGISAFFAHRRSEDTDLGQNPEYKVLTDDWEYMKGQPSCHPGSLNDKQPLHAIICTLHVHLCEACQTPGASRHLLRGHVR